MLLEICFISVLKLELPIALLAMTYSLVLKDITDLQILAILVQPVMLMEMIILLILGPRSETRNIASKISGK